MKKLFLVLALAMTFAVSAFAAGNITSAEKDESKWSTLSYSVVPILKIMEARDGYVVIYQKNKIGVGSTVIPKTWAKGNTENPRKLKFRKVKKTSDAYMTIVKEDGNFKRVILNVPMSKSNNIWGVVGRGQQLEGLDKENLDDLAL